MGNQAVRTWNWKYRHGHRYGNWSGVRDKPNPKERQLFNLAVDPGESRDLADENPELLQRLITQWEAYAEDVGVILPEQGMEIFGS